MARLIGQTGMVTVCHAQGLPSVPGLCKIISVMMLLRTCSSLRSANGGSRGISDRFYRSVKLHLFELCTQSTLERLALYVARVYQDHKVWRGPKQPPLTRFRMPGMCMVCHEQRHDYYSCSGVTLTTVMTILPYIPLPPL